MSDKIKILLTDKWEHAINEGAHYAILDNNECVFYDKEGNELWREKATKRNEFMQA